MHTSAAVVLVASLFAQQTDPPPFVKDHAKTFTLYYKSPNPELGPQLLAELLKKENLEHSWFADREHLLQLMGSQFGDIAAGKPTIVRKYESAFANASLAGRRVILRALMNCGDRETHKQVETWLADQRHAEVRPELKALKKHLDDPNRKHVRDRPAQSPDDLDLLWANFFITGEYAPVSRILDVLELPDRPDNETLKRVARWSLGSNLHQHPKLVELVQKHTKDRSEMSQKIIAEVMQTFQAEEAQHAVIIGEWVSDDREKLPLSFQKDGAANVGFIKKNGKWLIATGVYTVSDTGEVQCRVKYEGSTLFQTWTLKDNVLHGSDGPRQKVRWVKVKENKEKEDQR